MKKKKVIKMSGYFKFLLHEDMRTRIIRIAKKDKVGLSQVMRDALAHYILDRGING